MARSRSPRIVVMSDALSGACACRSDSQFPTRIPCVLALFTRLMPAANSGASNPLSAASAASLRIADVLIMMDDERSRRSSRDTRQALTVALVKPGRGACWNHPIISSNAMLYTLFVIGDETLSRTRVFNFCHCAIFSRLINSFIQTPVIGHYR